MLIDYWKVQCAGKEIMTDIKKFEKECNKNGDKTSVPYPGDTRTLEMIKGDLSERAEDACPSMPNVDEGCEDEDAIRLIRMWRKQCKGKSEDSFKKMVDKYEDWCANGFADNYITDELYKDYSQSDFVTKISEEINKKCKVTSNNNGGNVDYTKITGYGSALDGIIGDLDLSVWKNADGKFNTARLASDSIAGVVLGTAGGLITSSVMKKHQAADGFEDLKCVVGGQSVAGWGDVFNVGIQ
jgi:hypothetical protein